jgi:hypothetical protein
MYDVIYIMLMAVNRFWLWCQLSALPMIHLPSLGLRTLRTTILIIIIIREEGNLPCLLILPNT